MKPVIKSCVRLTSSFRAKALYSCLCLLLFSIPTFTWAAVYRVDDDAAPGGDGLSWAAAFKNIQEGVDAADADGSGEVWVAEGTYTSTEAYVVELKEGVALYGGFKGVETSLDERDWSVHRTIIDGRGVGRCVKGATNAVLDGFQVENGDAGEGNGGGIVIFQCSPVIRNCSVSNCVAPVDCGGGVYINSDSFPTLENCTITDCFADYGGGIYVGNESELTLLSSKVAENEGNIAGGIRTFKSIAHVTNCLLVANNASEGGAMNNYESTVNMLNCSVLNNVSYYDGSAMWNDSDAMVYISNSILWGNDRAINRAKGSMNHCCISEESVLNGENNIQVDPMICPASYRLLPGSPCIDAGDSSIADLPEDDYWGQQRVQGDSVDIGACEYDSAMVPTELTVVIAPQEVLPLQPKWSFISGVEGSGGQTVDVYPGEYELEFTSLGNWQVPDDRQVTVTPGGTTKVFEYRSSRGSRIRYVDTNATGLNIGTSWGNAYTDIQEAIDAISETDFMEVWVAAGTFTSKDWYVVEMAENIHLYGGFSGTEKNRDERNWVNNPTIIDGQYYCKGVEATCHSTLDGFVVANAKNTGIFIERASPVIRHCIIRDTWGSGVSISYWSKTPFSSPVISNCLFTGNRTIDQGGGIKCHSKAAPIISSCTFVGNQASAGGAIYKSSVNAVVDSCVIWNNSSGIEGTDVAVSYSCVQGGCSGVGNISSDPMLSPETFRPLPSSPCIDAGNPQFTDGYAKDLSVTARLENSRIDMGAYEEETPAQLVELVVSLSPAEILSENPKWRVPGYSWFDSGYALRLPPGEYNIEFYPVAHWKRPTVETIIVSEPTQPLSFEYTPSPGNHCWYVNVSATGDNNGTSWNDAFTEIQPAIDRASEDGFAEAWIAAGTYNGDGDNVIEISDGVHLYGGFVGNETERNQRQRDDYLTIIDGEDIRRCTVAEGSYTLDGLTFTRGKAATGAGLNSTHSEAVIKNCIFQNNHTGGDLSQGGAIYNVDNLSFDMVNCLIVDNSADEGGAVYSSRSTGDYRSCTFMSNITYTSSYSGTSSISNITNSIFWEIDYSTGYYGTLNISDCCSVYEFSGVDNILDDPMLDYFYRPLPDSPCIDVADPLASDLEDLDLRGNSRSLGNGADLGAYEFVADDQATTLTITLGPLDELPFVPEWRLDNGPWQQGNSTVYLPSGTYRIEFSTIYGWSKPSVETITFSPPDADMHFDYAPMLNDPVVYVDCDAGGSQDGSSWDDAFTDIQSAMEVRFADGFGEIWVAEGIYTGTAEQVLEMKNQISLYGGFAGNETDRNQRDWETHHTVIDGQGERMCVRGANQSTLDGFIITNGRAANGAGMYNQDIEVNIRNCSFTANNAEENGGALFISSSQHEMPAIEECFFLDNSAINGGAVCNVASNPTTLTLNNCYFYNNQADEKGGGVYNMGYSLTIFESDHCHFSGNTATDGGALYTECNTVLLSDCEFLRNNASSCGGGVNTRSSYSDIEPSFSACLFEGNHCDLDGGAVYVQSARTWLNVTDSVFLENSAAHNGGAMNNSYYVSVRDCHFDQNEAEYDGGAIYGRGTATSVNACIFTGNKATRMGGGVANYFRGSGGLVNQSIFMENQAGYGGAISNYSYLELEEYLQNSTRQYGTVEYRYTYAPDVKNSLFIRNQAELKGNGIYNYSVRSEAILLATLGNDVKSTPPIFLGATNNIYEAPLINHCTFIQRSGENAVDSNWPSESYQRIVSGGAPFYPYVGYYENNYSYHSPKVTNSIIWHEGDTDHNPGFRNPSEDDYRLTAQSMYIDAGSLNDDTPQEDLRGFPRPNGDLPDRGAYEYYDTMYPSEVIFTLLNFATARDSYDLNGDGLIDAADLLFN
jgi:predicted outer membrane repeat protein